MSEKFPKNKEEKPAEINGVSFHDYTIRGKDSFILVPKPPSRAEILRKEPDLEKERLFQSEKVAVATQLVERCSFGETFPFPGLRPEKYASMKSDWEEAPDYAPDVDELIARFQNEGMKVVFGNDPTSGNVFILPAGSNDIVGDSILPRLLDVNDISDDTLLELVTMENLHFLRK